MKEHSEGMINCKNLNSVSARHAKRSLLPLDFKRIISQSKPRFPGIGQSQLSRFGAKCVPRV